MKLDKEKVAKWYKQGLWTAEMVRESVKRMVLTEEQAAEILSLNE